MQLFSRAAWPLAASLAYLGVVVNAAAGGVLEVDMVFPRNETYAPTDSFPILFGYQNAELAWHLNMDISYIIRNRSSLSNPIQSRHELRWANWSTHDPYFVGKFFREHFAVEGQWRLTWDVSWQGCLEGSQNWASNDARGSGIISNSSVWSVDFTISSDGQPVDLVAATANTKTCPEELGAAIKVTGETGSVNSVNWSGDTCAILDISSPTPTPNPCAIKIDSATAASISASWTARVCNITFPPDYCPPKEDNASQRLAVAGVASLAAVFGAFGFLLQVL